jgi:hypothetical protein
MYNKVFAVNRLLLNPLHRLACSFVCVSTAANSSYWQYILLLLLLLLMSKRL